MEPQFIEYLTANEHVAYPFKEGARGLAPWSEVVVTGTSPTAPLDFLSDLVIVASKSHAGSLYLALIDCVSLSDYILRIHDDAGDEVITIALTIDPAPAVHSVLQEVSSTPSYAVRLLTGPTFVDYLAKIGTDVGAGGNVDFEQTLPFETATIEFRPDRIEKVRFKDSLTELIYNLDTDVGLFEGFNMELSVDGEDITVAAQVGSGVGKNDSNCDDDVEEPSWTGLVTSLGGTRPDEDGNINLSGPPCYRFEADPENHRIFIYNECEPCCTCDDYAAVLDAINRRLGSVSTLRLLLGGLVSQFNKHVSYYNKTTFPLLRTFTFFGHIMVGSQEHDDRGYVQSSATATMSLTLTNRVSHAIDVVGEIEWSDEDIELLKGQIQGTEGGQIDLDEFKITLEPFTEVHMYWLVQSTEDITLVGLTADVTAKWTQYGIEKELTRTITE